MPNNLVASYARQTGKSRKSVEGLWRDQEHAAKKRHPRWADDRIYAYINGTVRKILKLDAAKDASESADFLLSRAGLFGESVGFHDAFSAAAVLAAGDVREAAGVVVAFLSANRSRIERRLLEATYCVRGGMRNGLSAGPQDWAAVLQKAGSVLGISGDRMLRLSRLVEDDSEDSLFADPVDSGKGTEPAGKTEFKLTDFLKELTGDSGTISNGGVDFKSFRIDHKDGEFVVRNKNTGKSVKVKADGTAASLRGKLASAMGYRLKAAGGKAPGDSTPGAKSVFSLSQFFQQFFGHTGTAAHDGSASADDRPESRSFWPWTVSHEPDRKRYRIYNRQANSQAYVDEEPARDRMAAALRDAILTKEWCK